MLLEIAVPLRMILTLFTEVDVLPAIAVVDTIDIVLIGQLRRSIVDLDIGTNRASFLGKLLVSPVRPLLFPLRRLIVEASP